MTGDTSTQAASHAKPDLRPAVPRARGVYECPLCRSRQDVDGNCPVDGIPLRRLGLSER